MKIVWTMPISWVWVPLVLFGIEVDPQYLYCSHGVG